MVVATQNPIEHAGTFPLPEAQLDRFLLHVVVDMPDEAAERAILDLVEGELNHHAEAMPVRLSWRRSAPPGRPPSTSTSRRRSRTTSCGWWPAPAPTRPRPDLRAAIEHPASPRGTLALMMAGKARA